MIEELRKRLEAEEKRRGVGLPPDREIIFAVMRDPRTHGGVPPVPFQRIIVPGDQSILCKIETINQGGTDDESTE